MLFIMKMPHADGKYIAVSKQLHGSFWQTERAMGKDELTKNLQLNGEHLIDIIDVFGMVERSSDGVGLISSPNPEQR